MTFARACMASVAAGVFADDFFNGSGVWGVYLLFTFILLCVVGVIDVRTMWRAGR